MRISAKIFDNPMFIQLGLQIKLMITNYSNKLCTNTSLLKTLLVIFADKVDLDWTAKKIKSNSKGSVIYEMQLTITSFDFAPF